jgi:hypothetical protein
VFAELHAVTLRDTVSMAMPFQRMSEAGELADGEIADRAFAVMLNRLEWWTSALSAARAATPYSLSAGNRSA